MERTRCLRKERGIWWIGLGSLLLVITWMLTAQLLAFLRLFRLPLAMAATGVLGYGVLSWYRREGFPVVLPKPQATFPSGLSWFLGMTGFIALGISLFPLIGWPVLIHRYQIWVPWDVVYYHLPKAVDLLQKGHMWNLALPYGQYPLGWEALLTLLLGLQGHALGLGMLSAWATAMWAFLVWALLRVEARLPVGPALFVVGLLAVATHLGWRLVPWHIISFLLLSVGKNDLLAAALVLFGLLHVRRERLHRCGYLLSLAGAWAVKPWAGIFLLGLGLAWTLRLPSGRARWLGEMSVALLLGNLWLIRNFVLMGRPLSPIADILQRRALLWQVFHPDFWGLPRYQLGFITGVLLGLLLWSLFHKAWRYSVGMLAGLYGVFVVTPAVVLPAGLIQWRFALALLSWMWVLLVRWGMDVWPWTHSLGRRFGGWVLAFAALAIWFFFPRIPQMWMTELRAKYIIEDPFLDPVSEGPYRSVFAYIDQNLHDARIEANVPLYYVYDAGLTNEGVRPGHFPAGMPNAVPQPQPTHRLFCSLRWQWRGNAFLKDPDEVQEVYRAWKARGYRILYVDQACVLAQLSK